MKAFRLALLASRGSARARPRWPSARNAPTEPVTVGFLPKLDTDPYFQVAKGGAEEAAKEIGGKRHPGRARRRRRPRRRSSSSTTSSSQKVGVIAIAGNDANAVAPALKRAVQAGRPGDLLRLRRRRRTRARSS